MTDFLITTMVQYPWFTWLLVFFAAMGLGYAAVWAHKAQLAVWSWLGYRTLVWRSKAAVRRRLLEADCPVCMLAEEGLDEAMAGDDPPEYQHPDGDDGFEITRTWRPESGEDWVPDDDELAEWGTCKNCGNQRFTFSGSDIMCARCGHRVGDDPPEYQPDDDELVELAEPDEDKVLAFLHAVKMMGMLNDDDQLPDGPPRCSNRDCFRYGDAHPGACDVAPTMPAACYTEGPAMPPQPVCDCLIGGHGPRIGGAVHGCPVHDPEGTEERRRMLLEGPAMPPQPVREYLHPQIMDDLKAAGFSEHETTDGAVDSMFTRAEAREVQAMITDGVIPTGGQEK